MAKGAHYYRYKDDRMVQFEEEEEPSWTKSSAQRVTDAKVKEAQAAVWAADAAYEQAQACAPGSTMEYAARKAWEEANRARSEARAAQAAVENAKTPMSLSKAVSSAETAARNSQTAADKAQTNADRAVESARKRANAGQGMTADGPGVESSVDGTGSCNKRRGWKDFVDQVAENFVNQLRKDVEEVQSFTLGAANTVGHAGIDLITFLAGRLVGPASFLSGKPRSYFKNNIEYNANEFREWLDNATKGHSPDNVAYAKGQLTGDTSIIIVEWVGLVKGAKGVTGAMKSLPKIFTALNGGGSLVLAEGSILESAVAGAGAWSIAAEIATGIVAGLFNVDNFIEHYNELQDAIEKPDYIKENRVPQDKETVLNEKEYKRTNYTNKGARVYEKDGYYYCRDTFHKGEAAHLEVFDKLGNHLGEANPLTGEIIPNTIDVTKKLILR